MNKWVGVYNRYEFKTAENKIKFGAPQPGSGAKSGRRGEPAGHYSVRIVSLSSFSKMLQMYGPLLGIYAIPNLDDYMGTASLTQFGTA